MAIEADWPGASGKKYRYQVYPLDQEFVEPVAGNYIFVRLASDTYHVVYIGETEDLSERFDNHHKWSCIQQRGANQIHAHANSGGQAARRAEEADLIDKYKPHCNG